MPMRLIMGSWVKVLIVALLTSYTSVWADSERDESLVNQAAECCATECEQLQNRVKTLEAAVRGIISAMASQKAGQLAGVNKILERNVALRAIISSSTTDNGTIKNATLGCEHKGAVEQRGQEKNYSTQLRTALKCSLAHLLDINSPAESDVKTTGKIQVSFSKNNALEIIWTPDSVECLQISSGIWLRVFESSEKQLIPPSAGEYFTIPSKCLKRTNASYSIVLHKPLVGADKKKPCSIELKNDLVPCLAYTVEMLPNYQSLKGRPLLAEIIIPPSIDNSTISKKSLISLVAESDTLSLKWKDNSGCASRLTAVHLKIFSVPITEKDGKFDTAHLPLSFDIPRNCFHYESEENAFSLSLSRNHTCPVQLGLDTCRKYTLELKSEYQDRFDRPSTFWNTFTAKQELNQQHVELLNCTDSFRCKRSGVMDKEKDCIPYDWVCDGENDCTSGEDEFHCSSQCNSGFRCGRQCIPESLVCDEKYDCFDGSDEMLKKCAEFQGGYSSFACYELSFRSGQLYDKVKSQPFHWSKSIVLISAEEEHTIWLSINSFRTYENHFLKVYDGPYSSSPLLLSHSGSTSPPSVRSSSNKLYLEFPSYSYNDYGIKIFYTTMNNTGQPFVPGYIFGDGVVSSQNPFSSSNDSVTDCVWFVDARESNRTIGLLRRASSVNETAKTSITLADHLHVGPVMIVYDGWGLSGQVLYDERVISSQERKSAVYSIGHKTTVQFIMPMKAADKEIVYWDVFSMSAPEYIKVNTNGSSGTIKSSSFEEDLIIDNTEYHWHLATTPNSTIQLLFAYLKTHGLNCVQVYDGPTVRSNILLDKSGEAVFPFVVTSSTNELLVRYLLTWSDNSRFRSSGFLAVYSTL